MDEIEITIEPNGTIVFSAYCLRTDSWQDYKWFLAQAEQAQDQGDKRTENRSLRAALLFFFSDMEGVLNHICTLKGISDRGSLDDRAKRVEDEARNINSGIPSLSFRLGKCLRDLIAHAGITKKHEEDGHKEMLTQETVFERFSIATLRGLEDSISPWLDQICQALGVERFTDTEGECKEVGRLFADIGNFKILEV